MNSPCPVRCRKKRITDAFLVRRVCPIDTSKSSLALPLPPSNDPTKRPPTHRLTELNAHPPLNYSWDWDERESWRHEQPSDISGTWRRVPTTHTWITIQVPARSQYNRFGTGGLHVAAYAKLHSFSSAAAAADCVLSLTGACGTGNRSDLYSGKDEKVQILQQQQQE